MKPCAHLDGYLTRELDPQQAAVFQAHLLKCERCGDAAAKWKEVETELASMARCAQQEMPAVDDVRKRRLIERARASFEPQTRSILKLRPVFVAAIALIVGGLTFMVQDRLREETGDLLRIEGRLFEPGKLQSVTMTARLDQTIEVPSGSRVLLNIGNDTVGLGPKSSLVIVKAVERNTQLDLQQGTVVCSVCSRKDKGDFVVKAGRLNVRVVGTTFAVARSGDEDVEIDVISGNVEVTAPGQTARRVSAGQRLKGSLGGEPRLTEIADDKKIFLQNLLSEKPQAAPAERNGQSDGRMQVDTGEDTLAKAEAAEEHPRGAVPDTTKISIDVWRAWIIEGRLDDAQRALESHLAQKPQDGEAWSLLADCRRKNGDWSAAVQAYRKVVAFAPVHTANRARFRAAALLQEKLGAHREAIELLEAYINLSESDNALHAEALFRLAQSYLALGQNEKAMRLLEEIVSKHKGSPSATQARRILNGNKTVD
jgi:TolA-binding protein